MGIETAIMIGMAGMSAYQTISAGEDQAEALVNQTNLQNEERAKRTKATAGSQKVSFLNSGLTLEGTPMSAIQETYKTGAEDIKLASENAQKQADTIVSNARTEALMGLVQAGVSAGMGGMGGVGGTSGGTLGGGLDIAGDLKGINVPFTGTAGSFSDAGTIIPGTKPTRINF